MDITALPTYTRPLRWTTVDDDDTRPGTIPIGHPVCDCPLGRCAASAPAGQISTATIPPGRTCARYPGLVSDHALGCDAGLPCPACPPRR